LVALAACLPTLGFNLAKRASDTGSSGLNGNAI